MDGFKGGVPIVSRTKVFTKTEEDTSFLKDNLAREVDTFVRQFCRNFGIMLRPEHRQELQSIIMNESYYITNFDMILISEIYEIPLTLVSSNVYIENNKEILSMNIKAGNTYIVITPIVNKYEKAIQKFKLIINKEEDALLDISKLPEESLRNEIVNQTNTVIDLLKSFEKINESSMRNDRTNINDKKTPKKKTKLKLI